MSGIIARGPAVLLPREHATLPGDEDAQQMPDFLHGADDVASLADMSTNGLVDKMDRGSKNDRQL